MYGTLPLYKKNRCLNFAEGDEHVEDDIAAEHVWIVQSSFHVAKRALQLLRPRVLFAAFAQVRQKLLLHVHLRREEDCITVSIY
jgi:hypothetical protein